MRQVTIAQFGKVLPYLPLYVAQSKGFFDKQGLQVEIVNAYGDHSTWGMVARGDAQFGVADPLLMIDDAKVKGVVLAAFLQKSAIYGIAKVPQCFFLFPIDFSGKKIGVFGSPSTSFALLQKISADCAALGAAMPEQLEMEFTTELGHLHQPGVDAVLMTEPSASVAEASGAYRVFNGSNYFGEILTTALFARADYVDANPTIVQGVVSAIENSFRLIHKEHSEALIVARDEFPEVEKTAVEFATMRLFADNVFPKNSIITDKSWYALKQIRSSSAEMPLFRTFVENRFAINACAAPAPLHEVFSLKPGIWGFSVDLKAWWRNMRSR